MSTQPDLKTPDLTLNCPHDNRRMQKEKVGDVTIDRCGACGRLWLDDGEMQRLLEHKSAVHWADSGPFGRESARAALGSRVCPRDGRTLLEVKHPQKQDVMIEFCPGCRGVLLDAGELRQISGDEVGSWLSKIQKLVRW